jgi:hypothetical protein
MPHAGLKPQDNVPDEPANGYDRSFQLLEEALLLELFENGQVRKI